MSRTQSASTTRRNETELIASQENGILGLKMGVGVMSAFEL